MWPKKSTFRDMDLLTGCKFLHWSDSAQRSITYTIMLFDHPIYDQLKEFDVILGLLSPRRKEILHANVGIRDFKIVKSTFEEDISKDGKSDLEYVTKTAEAKIPSILEQLDGRNSVLIAADTIVSCEGKVYEKPGTAENQLAMLKAFRSSGHVKVITSVQVVVLKDNLQRRVSGHEVTDLQFNTALLDKELQHYVNCEEGFQVAGGFQYQSIGNLLFTGLQGEYFNVVGLPATKTFSLLCEALRE